MLKNCLLLAKNWTKSVSAKLSVLSTWALAQKPFAAFTAVDEIERDPVAYFQIAKGHQAWFGNRIRYPKTTNAILATAFMAKSQQTGAVSCSWQPQATKRMPVLAFGSRWLLEIPFRVYHFLKIGYRRWLEIDCGWREAASSYLWGDDAKRGWIPIYCWILSIPIPIYSNRLPFLLLYLKDVREATSLPSSNLQGGWKLLNALLQITFWRQVVVVCIRLTASTTSCSFTLFRERTKSSWYLTTCKGIRQ